MHQLNGRFLFNGPNGLKLIYFVDRHTFSEQFIITKSLNWRATGRPT